MFRILSWYFRAYTCISDFIHVLQNVYLYFRSYMYITELILVLRNLYWSYGSYTCITKLILVFRILNVCYITYTCISDLTCILWNLYLSYGTYSCVQDLFLSYRSYFGVTEPILVFRILFFCEGTRRYDKSEHIKIIDSLYGNTRRYYWTYIILQDLYVYSGLP